jgi:hypothetical protein
MRRRTALATAAVAGGAGLVLLATPVLAADPVTSFRAPTSATCTGAGPAGTGQRAGNGYGFGMGPQRIGNQRMAAPAANLPAAGTLTAQQRTTLAAMAEEEKLSHDVYTALAASTSDSRFSRIASSEQRHLEAVRVLMTRYSVTDPTAGKAVGQFTTPAVQASYIALVAQGKQSLADALTVGRTIEKADIADLKAAMNGLTGADVATVYQRLLNASQHHLNAFAA